jgi:hypothetical protein
LIEFLLSDEAEETLAHHQRGHIPLKPNVHRPSEVKVPGEFNVMAAGPLLVYLASARHLLERSGRT